MLRLIVPLLMLVHFFFHSQADDRWIEWRSDHALSWEDFKGQANPHTEMLAHTKSRISFKWKCEGEEFSYDVIALFDTQRSWSKSEVTDHLLAHEQLHFDITELYARKLRQTLDSLESPCLVGKEMLNEKAAGVRSAWEARQDEYDEATNHSKDYESQDAWEIMIAQELEALKDFALE